MPKLRRMLSDIEAPYLQSLMRLMETQSTRTLSRWCDAYARAWLLPLWRQSFAEDLRPETALHAAQAYLDGTIKLPQAKERIRDCRNAAREAEGLPVAQGAARAIDSAASAIYNPAGALGLALYGAVAIAYSEIGTGQPWESIEQLAAAHCVKMQEALRAIAVPDEPNPAGIKWGC